MFQDGGFKDMVSINMKTRDDNYADQFSRIFIVKMLVLSAVITGYDYFNDSMSCIKPSGSEVENDYIQSLCWIQGFYIYTDVYGHIDEFHAYGMPRDPDKDGLTKTDNSLCETISKRNRRNKDCIPLTRMYFNQYQYFPFYITMMAVLYYIPYMMFRIANSDIIALKAEMCPANEGDDSTEKGAIHISNTYFNYNRNGGVVELRVRLIANTIIKVMYCIVNLGGFWFTDKMLNNRYQNYVNEWIEWGQRNNTFAYRFASKPDAYTAPKPGEFLLPSLGFCDVVESYHDNLDVHSNKYKTICEISPHILYQYVLLIMWFVLVAGIVISMIGLVHEVYNNVVENIKMMMKGENKKLGDLPHDFEALTFRELQYIKMIRQSNDILYTEICTLLRIGKKETLL